jgi:hypothetical protein
MIYKKEGGAAQIFAGKQGVTHSVRRKENKKTNHLIKGDFYEG